MPGALRTPVFDIVGRSADQATYDTLKRLGIAASDTEEKLRCFWAMAKATDPSLIRQNAAFAASGAIPNGRITRFLKEVSASSKSPDLLYAEVAAHEAELSRHLPPSGFAETPLTAAAWGSSDPRTARALLAAKSSSENSGAHVQAARVAGRIEAAAALRARAEPALAAWLKGAPT